MKGILTGAALGLLVAGFGLTSPDRLRRWADWLEDMDSYHDRRIVERALAEYDLRQEAQREAQREADHDG